MDLNSPINREDVEVQHGLNTVRRCYYVLFQPMADVGFLDPDLPRLHYTLYRVLGRQVHEAPL